MKKAICYGSTSALGDHQQRLEILKDAGFDGIEAPQFDTTQETKQVGQLCKELAAIRLRYCGPDGRYYQLVK